LSFLLQFRGEIAALTAALIWAIASIVYTGVGRQITPLALNFTKGWIAVILVILTLLLTGHALPEIDGFHLFLLFLSGTIGIGFGDTAYFNALNCIGARRTLLFETLAPPLSAHENFRPLRGSIFGLLAALGQASGAVMSRAALVNSEIDSLWSTLIRLLGGTIALLIWIMLKRQSQEIIKPVQNRRLLMVITGTGFVSTYLGILLQQTSLKFAATGIAQALSSTSPLFVIPLTRIMGDRVSMRSVIGVLIALVGVGLLFQRL
jgi:drug/metabolite transporter (DMT)-like permease